MTEREREWVNCISRNQGTPSLWMEAGAGEDVVMLLLLPSWSTLIGKNFCSCFVSYLADAENVFGQCLTELIYENAPQLLVL